MGIDRALEGKILWKLDTRILPLIAIMYLFNSIDKSNLGNAKTDGLDRDLGLVGNQYNLLLSLFYIPFVLTAPGMNLLTKKFGAKLVLPISMICFGAMAMLSAATTNFGGLLTTRWFLGMAESGFYPGVIFYLTTFYKRSELAGRLSFFYAASVIAGAFTGLIAYGVFQIKSSLFGWQYLFLIEGSLTVAGGVLAIFLLPKSSATAYFLTSEEKELAYYRMATDSSTVVDAQFDFKRAISVFKKDLYMCIAFGLMVPQLSVQLFLPQIIGRLGYSTVRTNLLTVAPNVVASIFTVLVALSSDYTGDRFIHLATCLVMTCVGFIVLATIDTAKHTSVGLFCAFLLTCGAFITSPLLTTWYNNNTPDENQRAILTPVLVALGNSMGLVSSNIFRAQDAPNYVLASIISACFGAVGAVISLGLGYYMKWDNTRRNREQGVNLKAKDVFTSDLGDGQQSANWRWMGGIP
ncbi:major facilitator superfamily domain-containing protein [Xylogone sp. PMI_703]|nr:major facilitator superfamily domain-containing protein [Xylogone sp. PMI_703]